MLAFAAGHAVMFVVVLGQGNSVFFDQASSVFSGMLPYRDFVLEYPPLALAALLPPRLLGADMWSYGRFFAYEMLLADLAGLVLVLLCARRLRRSAPLAMAVYSGGVFALGSLASQRYDLFPAVLVLWAMYAFIRGKYTECWLALALGTAAKAYPALLAPLVAMQQVRGKDYLGLGKGAAVFALVSAAIFLPWVFLGPSGSWESMQFQLSRGLELESTYASALMVGQYLGLPPLQVMFRHGANDVVSPLADGLARAAGPMMVVALAAVYWLYWRRSRAWPARMAEEGSRGEGPLSYWMLAVLAFLLTSKVLSPQFLLWLVPLALAAGRQRWMAWGMYLVAEGLSWYIFPVAYFDLLDMKPLAVSVLAVRNILLVALAVLLAGVSRASSRSMAPADGGAIAARR